METNEENDFTEETAPAPAEYEPIRWDEDHPDRLDLRYYPGVRSLHSKLVALLVFAAILPALISGFNFRLIILALLPTGTLIWSCKQAVRNGSCDAIFLTRFTCFWLALPAFPALVGFVLFINNDGPTPVTLIYAGLFAAVVYLGVSTILQTYTNKDVRTVFPKDERSMTTMGRIIIIATTVLPMLLMMSCIIIY